MLDDAISGEPLALSIDSRVQQALEHELMAAMTKFSAIGAAGVVTNSMSTQVFGPYDAVMRALHAELRTTFEALANAQDKAVFVMKVLGPLTPA